MAIDAGDALRGGAEDLATARGVLIYVVFTVFALASLPIHQTLTRETTAFFAELADLSMEEVGAPATPLALDVDPLVVAVALVVIFLVAEVIRLLAIRSFASDASAAVPMAEVTDNWLPTLGILLAASILVQALVYGGMVVFIIPGIIAAVLTLFVRQAVVLDGEGVLDSLRRSISIVTNETAQVLVILVVLILASVVVGLPTIALDAEAVATPILGAILGSVTTVYGVAVLTRAYQQAGLEDAETTDTLDADELDDETDDAPGALSADDLADGSGTP